MRYVADPALVRWGTGPWLYLVILGALLPAIAIAQQRVMQSPKPPSRRELYASAIATHGLLLLLAWLVLRGQDFGLFPAYAFAPWHALVALAALALGFIPLVERLKLEDAEIRKRTRLIAPTSRGEHAFFYVVSATAGVSEEVAYRGLLFTIVASAVGSWAGAALITAVLFGIVHVFQGWKGAGVAALMGLREQLVVGLTGSLVIAIVVHALHDAIAGTVIARRARGEEVALVVS